MLPSPIPPLFTSKPHITFPNFCSQTAPPSATPPDRGVVTGFLLNKCGLSEEDVTKAFRNCDRFLRAKSSQNLEEVLELLNGCGLTTPAQIRKVVLCNPKFLFYNAKKNIQTKLALLKTFMTEEDISKLLTTNTLLFDARDDNLKSAISLLQGLGFEGQVLSELVATQPSLLMTSEEKIMKLFKQAEDLGFKKGSKTFAYALPLIWGVGKLNLERRLQCLSSLGFSEEQISELSSRDPRFLGLSEEKLKSIVDFMVNYVELPLSDLVKYPHLLTYSLEKRIVPRFRVMEALTSMQVQELKIPFVRIFHMTEKRFLEKYVNRNAKSPILRTIYHGGKAGKFIIDK
jgi:mTERF domain-containing protein